MIHKTDLYNKDLVAWADEQALLLKQKRWSELDLGNLIEEVQAVAGKYRDALESQLTRLLMHLLKWQYQRGSSPGESSPGRLPSDKRTKSWSDSIRDARKQISRLTRDHPSLAVHPEMVLIKCYLDACVDAADETGLTLKTFPLLCPYDLESEVFNPEFLPN